MTGAEIGRKGWKMIHSKVRAKSGPRSGHGKGAGKVAKVVEIKGKPKKK